MTQETERQKFEVAYVTEKLRMMQSEDSEHREQEIRAAWWAWQARAVLEAKQAEPEGDYLEGVNIPKLREALTFLGRGNGVGEGEVGAKLPEFVNSIVSGVLSKKELLATPAAPARKPLTELEIDAAVYGLGHGQPTCRQVARAIERAHGIQGGSNAD